MRGKRAKQRTIEPDAKYGSEVVSKFINYIMLDGKKRTAEGVVYKAMADLKQKKEVEGKKVNVKALEVLETAINNVKPKLEIRSRRVGGANYQVPVPVPPSRQNALAMKWIIKAAREARGNKALHVSLQNEIVSAFNNEGNAIKKKEDTIKMAEANKAFAQFA
jgi:small subunit ribosomal protein S7